MKKLALVPLILLLSSCAITGPVTPQDVTSSIQALTPVIEPAVATVGGIIFANTVPSSQKVADAKFLSGLGTFLYTLESGSIPTPDQFNRSIGSYIPNGSQWYSSASSLSGLYSYLYMNNIKGNYAVYVAALEQIAKGLNDISVPYLPASVHRHHVAVKK